MSTIQNKTFDEIQIGDTVSIEHTLRASDMRAWAAAFGCGDVPLDPGTVQDEAGLLTAMLTGLARTDLPGAGSSVRSTSVQIRRALPIRVAITVQLLVREKRPESGLIILAGTCIDAAGQLIATAVLEVIPPTKRQLREVPEHRLDALLTRCQQIKSMLTGVVHPCSAESLTGAVEAAHAGLIVPVIFGPEAEVRRIAETVQLDLSKCQIVATKGPEDSAIQAAMAAGAGDVQALMKGSLHSDALLHAIMQKEAKLRSGRLLSHCAMMSIPTYARRIVVTDAALNIAPDTAQKRDICQNAIGFALALGIELPKVAVLAAVETVNMKMPACIDGAILAKMSDRRQIVGGIVDGPLDLDAAVDMEAAQTKRISSPVAGSADVLLAPNIEAGNMIYKDLRFMADAQAAGLVVGARVPIILTSRADSVATRLFSTAAAVLYADALARDPASIQPELTE